MDIKKEISKEIYIDPNGRKRNFQTFDRFLEYVENEKNIWSKCRQGRLHQVASFYVDLLQNLRSIEQNPSAPNDTSFLHRINKKISTNTNIISSTTRIGKKILSLYDENPEIAEGFWNYYLGTDFDYSKRNYLKGAFEAHILLYKNTMFKDSVEKTNNEIDDFLKSYENAFNKKEEEVDNTKETIIKQMDEKSKEIDAWYMNTKEEYKKKLNTHEETLQNMESIYEEKLRIEAPSKYWETFSTDYKNKGRFWSIISGVIVLLIVLLSVYLLKVIPDEIFVGNKLFLENTIRWTILLGLIYSALFYMLRITIKMILSSYHLSRDASERLQLTHQYLALLKENVLEEKHREIIIQSLFSRAETGLLKGDSTPAMPDGVIGNILRALQK